MTEKWTMRGDASDRSLRMKRLFCLLLIVLVAITGTPGVNSTAYAEEGATVSDAAAKAKLDKLLPLVGGALASAGQNDWASAQSHVEEAQKLWTELAVPADRLSEEVDAALALAAASLTNAEKEPKEVKSSLSRLAKALNAYVKNGEEAKVHNGREAAASLLPNAELLLGHIRSSDWKSANQVYKRISESWPPIEKSIRAENFSVYGKLETAMSMIRIALQAEPPRAEQAEQQTIAFVSLLTDYKDGTLQAEAGEQAASDKLAVADAIAMLNNVSKEIEAGRYEEAEARMQDFISLWPAVEGEVQLRSPETYSKVEIRMTDVSKYLLANPPAPDKAEAVVASIRSRLEPLAAETRYTAFDAGMILFREGLEAILVLAALLAYLKRTGNERKSVWIWSGVWTGLALSAAAAIVLSNLIAQATAGSAREAMEGITGLVSVVLMLTVGNWLHNKANLQSWNRYIDGKMGSALARGSLWSLFAVAALAILREGAETTIFYIGMASSIDTVSLVAGIGVTFVLLVVLGFILIRFSAKLPIRPFFLTASALIYYLVFRFLGESIHSLQVAAWIPSHSSPNLPTIAALGFYPTWETALPQLAVLVIILGRLLWIQVRKSHAPAGTAAAE
ncbi:FTR1 family protein [Paenibacillus sp. NPDC058071]|uniref:FTR1 family iron permease n=1 Tax=Paenibacillus sp. NPDC058071 TaxID=3346326 RepID=UPI0036D8034B